MMLDGAEECQLSGPIGELVPFTLAPCDRRLSLSRLERADCTRTEDHCRGRLDQSRLHNPDCNST
jgi:hypothetical protein